MLSVCCLSGGPPARLAALLALLRPVADELVVAVDDRVDTALLAPAAALADTLVRYPFAEPVERPFGWLHSLCRGDVVFRIDDDEVPSAALLDLLRGDALPDELTHAFLPRRWLWQEGAVDDDPWWPDWQLRLVRPAAARFPGEMHIPVLATGPHAYVEAPLLHLDLLVNDRSRREEKARRYAAVRPGLRLGGRPLNHAYYLPEPVSPRVVPLPAEDAELAGCVLRAGPVEPQTPVDLPAATRADVDEHWGGRALREEDYRARVEVGDPPRPVAGEVRQVDVRVTNDGGAVWPAEGYPEIRLSYRWRGLDGEGLRTRFPHDVAPGEQILVPLSFRAPSVPGTYVLDVDVLHEGRRWFECPAHRDVEVQRRHRALVLLGQPPGDPAYDGRVDALLASLDPALEPVVVGPKPDWIRDRFRVEAAARPPAGPWAAVHALPAGRRRDRLRLAIAARRAARG